MDGLYFSVKLENGTTLTLSPLTDRKLSLCGEEIEDVSGYFLYEEAVTESGIPRVDIIAQVPSEEGALRLRAMLNMEVRYAT